MPKELDDCNKVYWSYHEEETGPQNWAHLCSAFSPCGGNAQSPVAIETPHRTAGQPPFVMNYGSSRVNIVNNGYTVQFNIKADNSLVIGGKTYGLVQFHYHSLSEHTIEGQRYPLEAHFVHRHTDDDLIVVGVMFREGDAHPLFSDYLEHFPESEGVYTPEHAIPLKALLPENRSCFFYSGSLTTPPCTEGVRWYMLQQPLTASREQLNALAGILQDNYRPLQPLNGRTIQLFTE